LRKNSWITSTCFGSCRLKSHCYHGGIPMVDIASIEFGSRNQVEFVG
jgi:hypothetical protein